MLVADSRSRKISRFSRQNLHRQPEDAVAIIEHVQTDAWQQASRSLIQVAQQKGKSKQRDGSETLPKVHQCEDQRSDHNRRPVNEWIVARSFCVWDIVGRCE